MVLVSWVLSLLSKKIKPKKQEELFTLTIRQQCPQERTIYCYSLSLIHSVHVYFGGTVCLADARHWGYKEELFIWEIIVSFTFHFSLRNREKLKNKQVESRMNEEPEVRFSKRRGRWSVSTTFPQRVEGEGWQGVKPSGSRVTAPQDGKVPEGRDFCLFCKQTGVA